MVILNCTIESVDSLTYISQFLEIIVGQFSQNRYIRSSFSNAVVGSTSADFHNLQGRLDNLFFAGEATDEDYWGYAQGGYLTGLKQAKMIFNCLNGKECEKYEREDTDICNMKNNAVSSAGFSYVFLIFLVVYIYIYV